MKILVIEASALHLGFLGCYGNDWVATPNLDRLAAEGVVFDEHYADCPDPAAGRTLAQRGLSSKIACESIAGIGKLDARSIRAIDRCDGTDSAVLWLDGPDLAPPWELPRAMLTAYFAEADASGPPLSDPEVGLAQLEAEARDRLQMTYAAVVTSFDTRLGEIMDHWYKAQGRDECLVCVTARYGLHLGEHGIIGTARPWLHDEFVHVPLVLRLPGAQHAGTRVSALTEGADLCPTIGEFLGKQVPEGRGCSLWPLVRGEIEQVRPYAVSGLRMGEREEWLLRTPELAFLWPKSTSDGDPPRQRQLYLKPEDRWEVNDLAPRHEEYAEQLEKTLRQFIAATEKPGPIAYPPVPREFAVAEETA